MKSTIDWQSRSVHRPEDGGIGGLGEDIDVGPPWGSITLGSLAEKEEGDRDPRLETGAEAAKIRGSDEFGGNPEGFGDLKHYLIAGDVSLGEKP